MGVKEDQFMKRISITFRMFLLFHNFKALFKYGLFFQKTLEKRSLWNFPFAFLLSLIKLASNSTLNQYWVLLSINIVSIPLNKAESILFKQSNLFPNITEKEILSISITEESTKQSSTSLFVRYLFGKIYEISLSSSLIVLKNALNKSFLP